MNSMNKYRLEKFCMFISNVFNNKKLQTIVLIRFYLLSLTKHITYVLSYRSIQIQIKKKLYFQFKEEFIFLFVWDYLPI